MIMNLAANVTDINTLIDTTKKQGLKWSTLENFKGVLRDNNLSFHTIPVLQNYLLHLQSDMFIFDCTATYLTVVNDTLYILAKKQHSLAYRLDYIELNSEAMKWENLNISIETLLRLRNVIEIIALQKDDTICTNLLSMLSSSIPA